MKKFFSVLLSVVFALCLLFTLLLAVVRFNFSYSTITNIASKAMKPVSKAAAPKKQSGLFYPGQSAAALANLTFDGANFENFEFNFHADNLKDLDVNALVQSFLDQAGVDASPELVAEILESPEASAFVDKYAEQVIDYMTGTKSSLDVDPKDVKKVMNKSVDLYEKHTGEKVDRSGMDQAIEDSVKAAVPKITASLDEAKEESAKVFDAIKAVASWLELRAFALCVAVCALLALAIFLINKNVFAMFKYISIPAIVDGALLFLVAALGAAVLSVLLSDAANVPKGIYAALSAYAASLFLQMKIYGIAAAVCGVVLCVLGFAKDKKTQKPNTAS